MDGSAPSRPVAHVETNLRVARVADAFAEHAMVHGLEMYCEVHGQGPPWCCCMDVIDIKETVRIFQAIPDFLDRN